MPRQFFRRFSPSRERISRQVWLRPFRLWLDRPELWAIRRKSIAPGLAIGLFWTWMPIPGHSLAAGINAILMRVHLPIAILMTAIVNPVTIFPIYYSAYRVGKYLLNAPDLAPASEWNMEMIGSQLDVIWQPLFLGSGLLGIASALLGYILIEALWRTRVGRYLTTRRRRLENQRR